MAKSIDLFLILLGSTFFLYPGNHELPVKEDVETTEIRAQLQSIYTNEIGVREKTNKNDGERIGEYLAYTGLSQGYAWCAAFLSWSFKEAGFKEPKTAWSPSLFPAKRIIWKRSGGLVKRDGKVTKPSRGDVFGIYYNSYKRIAHAGFVDEWGDKYAITVEGNTNDGGSREGDGVYRKRRPISSIYQIANWVSQ